jgi:hypothetical protein
MLLCRKARLLSSLKLFMSPDRGRASPLLPVGPRARAAAARPVVVGGSRLWPIPRPDRLLVNTGGRGQGDSRQQQRQLGVSIEARSSGLYAFMRTWIHMYKYATTPWFDM